MPAAKSRLVNSNIAPSFELNGLASIPDFLAPIEVTHLLDSLGKSSLTRSRVGVRHGLQNPAFADLAQEARLLTIARTILGPDARPFHATLFEKAHHANGLVVWHQDNALPLRRRSATPGWGPWSVKEGVVYAHAPASSLERGLAIRIHLDASNPDNGPLRVLPGTHTSGVPTDDAIHELTKSRNR